MSFLLPKSKFIQLTNRSVGEREARRVFLNYAIHAQDKSQTALAAVVGPSSLRFQT